MSPERILSRLQSGWRPGERELGTAARLEDWRLHPPGPYVLQGRADGHILSGVAVAADTAAGWARLVDRWVVLGARAPGPQPAVGNEEIMRTAAAALAAPAADAQSLARQARALARQASGAGFLVPAYLLDLAAEAMERGECW
jgi:hypothetical protein